MNTASICLAAAGIMTATSAWAIEYPKPSEADQRVRYVNYQADNIVPIWTVPGGIITLIFGADETLADGEKSEITDKHTVKARSHANVVVLKPEGCLIPQPMTIITNKPGAAGGVRAYLFEIHTTPAVCPAGPEKPVAEVSFRDQPSNLVRAAGGAMISQEALGPRADVQYAVIFKYPGDEVAKRRAEEKAAAAEWRKGEAKRLLEHSVAQTPADPYSGAKNLRYFWRGYAAMQPRWVWSTGYSTQMVFPGLQRIPTFAYLGPDGKETVETNFSVHGDTVVLPSTHALWILRDGESAVGEIAFPAWNAVGSTPGTGTSSPYVQLRVKGGER